MKRPQSGSIEEENEHDILLMNSEINWNYVPQQIDKDERFVDIQQVMGLPESIYNFQ